MNFFVAAWSSLLIAEAMSWPARTWKKPARACAVASAAWVVPFSAATLWPQRLARPVIAGPPWALT